MQEVSSKNLPSAIKYGGCAFLVAWFLLFFSGEIWGADFPNAAETVVVLSLVSIASCFLLLLILNWLGRKSKLFSKPLGIKALVWGALLSLGTLGIVFANSLSPVFFIIACIIIGCSGGVFICSAVLQFAQLTPRNILITCGSLFLVGILIYSFAFYVPHEATTVIICLLPFVGSIFFVFNDEGFITQTDTTVSRTRTPYPISWRAVLLLSIFMLFSCVVRGYLPYYIENATFSYIRSFSIILMLVLAAIVVIVPALLPTRYRISNLYRFILILGMVLFGLFPIFGMDNSIALVLADGYRGLIALMAIVYFACLARQESFFGLKEVCGGLGLFVFFGIVGWLVGSALHYTNPGEDFLRIYSSLQCVVVVLAFVLLYRQTEFVKYVDVDWQPLDADDLDYSFTSELNNDAERGSVAQTDDPTGDGGGRWRRGLHVLSEQKGLTQREEEIFVLLAKGYKAQNISERLVISYNTTRAHIRNIYQKCDVHSQQEFVDFIDTVHSLPDSPEEDGSAQNLKVH